jgi:hypothetical protein
MKYNRLSFRRRGIHTKNCIDRNVCPLGRMDSAGEFFGGTICQPEFTGKEVKMRFNQ